MITERVEYEVVIAMPSGMSAEMLSPPSGARQLKLVLRGQTSPADAKQAVKDFVQALRAEVNA